MPYPYRSLRDFIIEEEKAGNVFRAKVPLKCGDRSDMVDIGNGVPGKQPKTELRAFLRFLHSLQGKPIGIIEKPINNRPDIPVVENIFPGRERTLKGMGCKNKDEACKKLETVLSHRIIPVTVSKDKALCKQVVIPEANVDLMKNIPRCWVEFNQWCWAGTNGTVIARDPETGAHGLSKSRMGVFDWKEANPNDPYPEERIKSHVLISMSDAGGFIASNTGRYYYNKYRAQGRTMPAAVAFGVPADIQVIAAHKSLRWPATGDEYELIGGFRGEALDVVPSETIPDLMVPADAEWVVEGEFLNQSEKVPRYALDVYRGNLHGGHLFPEFKVKCITHRKQPWWTEATFSSSGLHGHEGNHIGLWTIEMEIARLNYLRSQGFKVKDVVGTSPDMMIEVVQLEVDGADKPFPHYGKKVAMSLSSAPNLRVWAKYIIVVGPDIDPYDLSDVLWAVGSRTMPVSDTVVSGTASAAWGDPRSARSEEIQDVNLLYGQQVLIDATIKIPERYDSWPPRSDPSDWERKAIEDMKEKLFKKQ